MLIAEMAPGGPIKYYGDLLDQLIQENRSVYIFHAYVIVVESKEAHAKIIDKKGELTVTVERCNDDLSLTYTSL